MGITAMFMVGCWFTLARVLCRLRCTSTFFVLLALLAVFANPMVIVAAAVTAAAHHATLWLILPGSVFNYNAPFWVVAVHAAFVVLESVAACFIARSFFDNVIGLEKIVAIRTAEVDHRNKDMRRILDAVEQGFLTMNARAKVSDERSAAVERLFGLLPSGWVFVSWIREHDQRAADWLEFGLEEVFAGIMPVETTIDQLPKRCTANGKTLQLEYFASLRIGATGRPSRRDHRHIGRGCSRNPGDREPRDAGTHSWFGLTTEQALWSFFAEAEKLVQSLQQESRSDMVMAQRRVHTLKGNTSVYGLDYFARLCHSIEDYMAENNDSPPEELGANCSMPGSRCAARCERWSARKRVALSLANKLSIC